MSTKQSSTYPGYDYAWGDTMLALRTAMNMTQAELSGYLGVSRRAMGEWERGNSYPKPAHLKEIIALAVQRRVFHAGHETEEIRAFWKAAHAKVRLDEHWLAGLLDGSALQDQVSAMSIENAVLDWGNEAWMERSIALQKAEKRHG